MEVSEAVCFTLKSNAGADGGAKAHSVTVMRSVCLLHRCPSSFIFLFFPLTRALSLLALFNVCGWKPAHLRGEKRLRLVTRQGSNVAISHHFLSLLQLLLLQTLCRCNQDPVKSCCCCFDAFLLPCPALLI